MILVITDTHCSFITINHQIEHALAKGHQITHVIHLGDFGIFKKELRHFFIKDGHRFIRPVYFIEGNHEDFELLPFITNKYREHLTHLKRSSVHSIGGFRFLAIGGAGYMDSMLTQQAAVISDTDIDHCLSISPKSVDIIISHDCPINIGVPNTKGLEYYGSTGFIRSDEIDHHFKPKLWLFGHHHKWFRHQTEHTRYFGLPAAWRGYGLLDQDLQFQFVENDIPLPENESYFDRLLKKLGWVRPNISQS